MDAPQETCILPGAWMGAMGESPAVRIGLPQRFAQDARRVNPFSLRIVYHGAVFGQIQACFRRSRPTYHQRGNVAVETLITRCIGRDPAAWEELIELYRPGILRVLIRVVGTIDPAVVHDLEQDLYARLLANDCEVLRGLKDPNDQGLRPFLHTTAMNLARDQRRRLGVRRVVQSGELEELASGVADFSEGQDVAYEKAERLQAVWKIVEEESKGAQADRDRMIFKAHFVDGLSASEVASMGVGLSPKGVETVLYRLIKRVRQAVRDRSEDAA